VSVYRPARPRNHAVGHLQRRARGDWPGDTEASRWFAIAHWIERGERGHRARIVVSLDDLAVPASYRRVAKGGARLRAESTPRSGAAQCPDRSYIVDADHGQNRVLAHIAERTPPPEACRSDFLQSRQALQEPIIVNCVTAHKPTASLAGVLAPNRAHGSGTIASLSYHLVNSVMSATRAPSRSATPRLVIIFIAVSSPMSRHPSQSWDVRSPTNVAGLPNRPVHLRSSLI
jgi:hypothetical protein